MDAASVTAEFLPGCHRADDPTSTQRRAGPCCARMTGAAGWWLVPTCGAAASASPAQVLASRCLAHCFSVPLFALPLPFSPCGDISGRHLAVRRRRDTAWKFDYGYAEGRQASADGRRDCTDLASTMMNDFANDGFDDAVARLWPSRAGRGTATSWSSAGLARGSINIWRTADADRLHLVAPCSAFPLIKYASTEHIHLLHTVEEQGHSAARLARTTAAEDAFGAGRFRRDDDSKVVAVGSDRLATISDDLGKRRFAAPGPPTEVPGLTAHSIGALVYIAPAGATIGVPWPPLVADLRHVGCRRIGEADHPGPGGGAADGPSFDILAAARRVGVEGEAATISYAQPRDSGMSSIMSPGAVAAPAPTGHADEFALVIETVNSTGWAALKQRLDSTKAHAVLAQETWVAQASVAAASRWAKAHGWRSVWSPAARTKRGGVSGGVAIFARDYLGLHYPSGISHEIKRARAVTATLEAPGSRPFRLVSCYLQHGKGAADTNAELLADIGASVRNHSEDNGGVSIIGGDFNMSPDQLLGTEYDRAVEATVFHTDVARGTFRTSRVKSTLDYFLISDRLAAAVDEIATVEGTSIKGHVPVQVTFKPRLTNLRALHIRQPPRLGLERVYGPIPPPPPATAVNALAEAALAAARAEVATFADVLEAAYGAWANLAEEEVENFTGTPAKLRGERAKRPRLVWRSVVPEGKHRPSFSRASAVTWLHAVAAELLRIARAAAAAAGDGQRGFDIGNGGMEVDGHDGEDDGGEDATAIAYGPTGDGDMGLGGDVGDLGPVTNAGRTTDSWHQASCVLTDIGSSLIDDFPEGNPDQDIVDLRDRLHDLAVGMAAAALPRHGERRQEDGDTDFPLPGTPWDRGAAARLAAWEEDARGLREALSTRRKTEEAAQRRADAASWKEWLSHDLAAGASRAHAFTRLPQEAVPSAVTIGGSAVSSTPEALLTSQRDRFRSLWKPSPRQFFYEWNDKSELPRITPEQLRHASRSFKTQTATTYDGFHPRHFACLSDDALQALGTILQTVELTGRWPRQLECVVTALLPKPKGGHRPIGLLPAVYRVWTKARRELTDRWEVEHARQYLSSAKGNGPLDTMWRMGARQEAGIAEGAQAGIVADDLAAFFETVDRQVLMREAAALHYPMPVLRGALAAYSAARFVTLQGRVSRELYPTVGVIAGCSLAMSLTKVFYLRTLDAFVARLPPTITLDVHVDDLTLSAIGEPRRVEIDLANARADLATVMEELGCTFAPDKTAVTATTRTLANGIGRRMGIEAGAVSTPCILGVDNTAGAARARLKAKSKKAARLRAALARRGRLDNVRRTVGSGASKIFRTGLLPAASYDAAVWGLSDGEVLKLRRLAATTLSPRARGRSLRMLMLWYGVPTADSENAPAVMYSKMIWRAVTRREEAGMRQAALSDVSRMWTAARAHFQPIVQMMVDARAEDGTIPPEVAKSAWAQVRGPIGAAAVTLARVGWSFASPFVLCDSAGNEHPLTATSPTLVRDLLRAATREAIERAVGARLAEHDRAFEGRRVCADLAVTTARAGRRYTPQQIGAFRAVVCGALWTADRARQLGYDTDGMCAMCRAARDTVRHRVYECPETRGAVQRAVPRWFWEEAQRAAPTDTFWVTGLFPHPGDVAPPPRAGWYCEVEHHTSADRDAAAAAGRTSLEGSIYVDGTCKPSPIRGLARAAMSLVTTSQEGRPIRTLQLPLPRHLPQTSQAAEYAVMSLAFDFLSGASTITGDCLNVVRKFTASARRALAPTGKYAGLVLSAFRSPDARRNSVVRWTRAHRTITGNETDAELADLRGNAAADQAAKEANELHPPLGIDVERDVDFRTKRLPHIITAVSTALALFPPAPKGMERRPRPANEDEARTKKQHLWRYRAGAWRCSLCDDYVTARSIPVYRLHQRCGGQRFADSATAFASRGHSLVLVDAELPITMCAHCGAWGNRRTRLLGQPCAAPTAAGKQAIKRLADGYHPLLQQDSDGRPAQRMRARVVATYDADRGRWAYMAPPPSQEHQRPEEVPPHPPARQFDNDVTMDARDSGDVNELPPSVMGDDIEDINEHDIFGHGGDLDEGGPPHGPHPITRAHAAVTDVQQLASSRPGGRRRSADDQSRHRDFEAEAIERLGAALRRNDTDASGRMARLRRRIQLKQEANLGTNGDGTQRQMQCQRGQQGPTMSELDHGVAPPPQALLGMRRGGLGVSEDLPQYGDRPGPSGSTTAIGDADGQRRRPLPSDEYPDPLRRRLHDHRGRPHRGHDGDDLHQGCVRGDGGVGHPRCLPAEPAAPQGHGPHRRGARARGDGPDEGLDTSLNRDPVGYSLLSTVSCLRSSVGEGGGSTSGIGAEFSPSDQRLSDACGGLVRRRGGGEADPAAGGDGHSRCRSGPAVGSREPAGSDPGRPDAGDDLRGGANAYGRESRAQRGRLIARLGGPRSEPEPSTGAAVAIPNTTSRKRHADTGSCGPRQRRRVDVDAADSGIFTSVQARDDRVYSAATASYAAASDAVAAMQTRRVGAAEPMRYVAIAAAVAPAMGADSAAVDPQPEARVAPRRRVRGKQPPADHAAPPLPSVLGTDTVPSSEADVAATRPTSSPARRSQATTGRPPD